MLGTAGARTQRGRRTGARVGLRALGTGLRVRRKRVSDGGDDGEHKEHRGRGRRTGRRERTARGAARTHGLRRGGRVHRCRTRICRGVRPANDLGPNPDGGRMRDAAHEREGRGDGTAVWQGRLMQKRGRTHLCESCKRTGPGRLQGQTCTGRGIESCALGRGRGHRCSLDRRRGRAQGRTTAGKGAFWRGSA